MQFTAVYHLCAGLQNVRSLGGRGGRDGGKEE